MGVYFLFESAGPMIKVGSIVQHTSQLAFIGIALQIIDYDGHASGDRPRLVMIYWFDVKDTSTMPAAYLKVLVP